MPGIRSGSTVSHAKNQEWIPGVPCQESGVDPRCPISRFRSGSTVSHMSWLGSGSTVSHATNQEWIHLICYMPWNRSGSTVSHAMHQEWIHCIMQGSVVEFTSQCFNFSNFGGVNKFIKCKNTNHFIKNNCVWVVFPSSLGWSEIQVTLHISIFCILSYYRPPEGGRLIDMKVVSGYAFLRTYFV